MAEQTSSALWRGRIRPDIAKRRITSFGKHFGTAHLYFAQHAAFPLAVTPELLYRLWANFQQDVNGEMLNIQWITVADLILSGLCTEVGNELYEMDVVVRAKLLSDLEANPRFGPSRIMELSRFLSRYIEHQLQSHDPIIRNVAITQQWIVLAYTRPDQAARRLALALRSSLEHDDNTEQLRMISLIDMFAESLVGFAPLLTYAQGIGYLIQGDITEARSLFNELDQVLDVAGVKLPIPINTHGKDIQSTRFPDNDSHIKDDVDMHEKDMQPSQHRIAAVAEKIAAIIEIRKPFAKVVMNQQKSLLRLAEAIGLLEKLRRQLIVSGSPYLAEQLKDHSFEPLIGKIEYEIRRLEKIKVRFSRSTLNIGVIGRTGQGKSRLLQSLSGLGPDVIPTGRGSFCTGVRSLICHNPDKNKAGCEIYFYSEREFLKDVLTPYYTRLKLGTSPSSINHFANQPLPQLDGSANHVLSSLDNPNGPGYVSSGEMYRHLAIYQDNIQAYRHLIGQPFRSIPIEAVREYVAQDDPSGNVKYYNHLAVREAKITYPFQHDDVGQIALLDMPGLGDTGVGDDTRLLQALEEHIDTVLFVLMPSPKRGVLADHDFGLYDLVYHALKGIPIKEWSFMVLNHIYSPNADDDNYDNCKRIKDQIESAGTGIQGRRIEVAECIIADCTKPTEAKEKVLEKILDYLVDNMHWLDTLYMSTWEESQARLKADIAAELDKARRTLDADTIQLDDEMLFENLFEKMWRELMISANEFVNALRQDSKARNSIFSTYLREILAKCREDSGILSADELQYYRNSTGSYLSVFNLALDKLRIHLTNHFSDIDERLKIGMDEVKWKVAEIFLGEGRLAGLIERRPQGEFFIMMATQETLSPRLREAFLRFERYEPAFRGFFLSRIRQQLDDITPDKTKIRFEGLSLKDLITTLRKLHEHTVYQLESTLVSYEQEPGDAVLAVLEQFIDQSFRSVDVKRDWRQFYRAKRAKIWASEFNENAIRHEQQREWQMMTMEVININKNGFA